MFQDIFFVIVAVLILLILWFMLIDTNRFTVSRYEYTDKSIKKDLKIAVLADLHDKKYGKDNFALLSSIRKEKPDIIVIAGDMINAYPDRDTKAVSDFVNELSKDYPVYYGIGNHEMRLALYPEMYGDMYKEYFDSLNKENITVLDNENVCLDEYGVRIYGLTIDKEYYSRFNTPTPPEDYMEKTLGECDKDNFTLLIAHTPVFFDSYSKWGAKLTVSGHMHGGIVRIPFTKIGIVSPYVKFFPKYSGGEYNDKEKYMVVSRGLGVHSIPFRLFNPGELIICDLKCDK